MRVFISWSGEPSRSVAQALRDWLPMVVQHVEPWMSDEDIDSGGRWNDQVAAELEKADYGIICLTASNLERPWLLFEAGALAKRFGAARVVPLLIDLKPADVRMPLASFQGRPLTPDGMFRLVKDMNELREPPLPSQQLDQLFSGMWPTLQAKVGEAKAAMPPVANGKVSRETGDVMAELVDTVRRIERRMDTLPDSASTRLNTARPAFVLNLTHVVAQLTVYERRARREHLANSELHSLVYQLQELLREARELLGVSGSSLESAIDFLEAADLSSPKPDEPELT
jgi:hypothetical protein